MRKRLIHRSWRELSQRVIERGYKDVDDFFKKNPVTPFVVLAKELGTSYQTISRHYSDWRKKRLILTKGGSDGSRVVV